MTNFEYIKNLNKKEMAKFLLDDSWLNKVCDDCGYNNCIDDEYCVKQVVEWLSSERITAMSKEDREKAIRTINASLDDNDINFCSEDKNELEVLREAMSLLQTIYECLKIGCTNFQLTPEELQRIQEMIHLN